MAFLKDSKVFDQTSNFVKRLPKWQLYVIGGIASVILFGLITIVYISTETKYSILVSGVEENESAKIVQMLEEKGISYSIEDDGSKIKVPTDLVGRLRLELASKGLPETGNLGYEIFDRTNIGMSEFVQKLNYRRALEGELAKTIKSLDEVVKARVHIVIPKKALFKKDQKKATASVTIHFKTGRSLNKLSIEGIQSLVANSIEGLKAVDVKVVDQKANMLSEVPLDMNTIAGKTAQQHEQQRKIEMHLEDKVKSIMDGVLGHGQTQISVNVELDFTQIEQTKTEYDPEGQVTRSEQNVQDESETADSLSYPFVNQSKKTQNQIANYDLSTNVEKIIHQTGTIKRLTASVLINGSVKILDDEGEKTLDYVPRSEEHMRKYTLIVRNALGFDPTRNDQVTVQNVAFDYTINEENISEFVEPDWYTLPENQKIMFLIAAIILSIIVMFTLLQSGFIKERIRIAMGLPVKVVIDDYDLEEEESDDDLEALDFNEDDFLMLPADLPDQLLIEEGDTVDSIGDEDLESELEFEKDSLADFADAPDFDDDLSEEALLKLEIKGKVEAFVEENIDEAVRLIRIYMGHDGENAENN